MHRLRLPIGFTGGRQRVVVTERISAEERSVGGRAAASRREILLRDGLVLLVLCLVTVALFGVTLFLFKSFEAHRVNLGRRWSARGRLALAGGRPEMAAASLRTALGYTPDDYPDQLLLAQALAAAGHPEAANNYFLGLWDLHPGDGFVNLQLARLARERGDAGAAIEYYRASIFGNWQGDGVARRREGRLELADYLAERGQAPAAEAELLIAAGNAPEKDVALQLRIADRLRALGDLADALRYDKVAVTQAPRNPAALASEGRLEYALGDYPAAARTFTEAVEAFRRLRDREAPGATAESTEWGKLAANARRLPELSLSRDLPASERATHLLLDAGIAQRRWRSCLARWPSSMPAGNAGALAGLSPSPDALAGLAGLRSRWAAVDRSLRGGALARSIAVEDTLTTLIDDTEIQAAAVCGTPVGDDALLFMLASQTQQKQELEGQASPSQRLPSQASKPPAAPPAAPPAHGEGR